MRIVIADTSPLNYLILIGHIDIIPGLFEKVMLPSVVRDELTVAPPSFGSGSLRRRSGWKYAALRPRTRMPLSNILTRAKRTPLRLRSKLMPTCC